MRILYSLLYTLLFIVALPYFLIVGFWKGKYISSFRQRLGFIPFENQQPACWVHAVSMGEFLAARPLIQKIREQFPELPVFISTTTATGQQLAQNFLPGRTFYFPFDFRRSVRRAFAKIRPAIVLVMETEIWPNFLWEARARDIPVILVNGRLSDRSFARYKLFARWLPKFSFCLMQSSEDARRMQLLRGSEDGIKVMGNLKFDFRPPAISPRLRNLILQWKGSDLLIIAGSTMPTEEAILIDKFCKWKQDFPLKLFIAPRHPQRFDEVADVTQSHGLPFTLRSLENISDEPVFILDSIGELAGCYEFADLVFIGGTLMPHGGHNPIEPAFFGKAIVTGTHYENFRSIFSEFQKRNAINVTENLESAVSELLSDQGKRAAMGHAARAIVDENAGAVEIALDTIREYIDARRTLEPHQKLFVR